MRRGLKLAHLQLADHPSDAIDLAIREAGHITRGGPRHVLHTPERAGVFHWTWRITDQAPSPHVVLVSGWAWTKRRAWKRRDRAYLRVLNGGAR